MTLAIAPNVAFEVLDGEAVILHLDAARYYSLNRTATCAWEAIAHGVDSSDAAMAVVRRFSVDEETARADVEVLVHRLVELGILEHTD